MDMDHQSGSVFPQAQRGSADEEEQRMLYTHPVAPQSNQPQWSSQSPAAAPSTVPLQPAAPNTAPPVTQPVTQPTAPGPEGPQWISQGAPSPAAGQRTFSPPAPIAPQGAAPASGQPGVGLTSAQVQAQRKAGKVNYIAQESDQTVKSIIKKNTLTYFNLIFAIIAVLLCIVGAFRDLTFMIAVVFNSVLGIIQQLRSKKVLDQLTLISKTRVQAIRDGKPTAVPVDDLVLGDVVLLGEGQQIPADAVVMSGEVAVNESLLTGEADEIEKKRGSELKSGSFIINGKCQARLTHVGADSYAAQLTAKAKEFKNKQSEMIRHIELIIRVAGIAIIPIGIMLLITDMVKNGKPFSESIVAMAGAVIGMIPQGLYLLVTVALALSAMRLARNEVLLHDMRSIETLARVDVLCVDKTGTITTNEMEVTEVFAPPGMNEAQFYQYRDKTAAYVNTITDSNITMAALRNHFGVTAKMHSLNMLPFSSKNKYSQIETTSGIFRLGAPEILLSTAEFENCRAMIEERASKGFRVLAFVEVTGGRCVPRVFVSIKNTIRKNATETFRYFKEQDVRIKVISGDNPMTVSKVALQAGIDGAEKYVDASTLTTPELVQEAATKYTVFGRVKPEQKKQLVDALKAKGLKVAMTGDGVNDILAMKQADCSIAMGSGSDAARQAAQVVLLDDDFSRMRNIVSEGRQIINNITRSATLFLYKNIFSMLLAIFAIGMAFSYPLQPQQVSLVSIFNIGIPAFLLALETNISRQEQNFLKKTMLTALPSSITSFFSIAAMVVFYHVFEIDTVDIGVASTYLLAMVGFMLLYQVSSKLNLYRVCVLVLCILGFLLCPRIPIICNFFPLDPISLRPLMLCVVFAFAQATVFRYITMLFETAQALPERIRQKVLADEQKKQQSKL